MDETIISLEAVRRERELKKKFPSDYELVIAFYLAKKLHAEDVGERESEVLPADKEKMQRWVQKRLADEVETRQSLRSASVYKMVPYVANLLVTHQGLLWRKWTPAQRLETNDAFQLLRVAEDSFFVFCFCPEGTGKRVLNYRNYALALGTRAYQEYGYAKKNPIGKDMEKAFAPLGSLVRELFNGRM